MRIEIETIKVAERIRKLTAGLDELAKDIQKNGLINPITVMAVEGGYQLLAGLRRLRATQTLGWEQIAVTVVSPKDAEAALNIEYSENVQREAFTFSEKMDYARLIKEIESAKARERMLFGKTVENDAPPLARGEGRKKRETCAIIGDRIGMSGAQYDRARYIADHAQQEVIDELDRGERTIYRTYKELRAAEQGPKATTSPAVDTVKESDLDRAIRAESELDSFKYRQHNEIYHRDGLIESLKKRVSELEAGVTELEAALEAANARIQELEGMHATTL